MPASRDILVSRGSTPSVAPSPTKSAFPRYWPHQKESCADRNVRLRVDTRLYEALVANAHTEGGGAGMYAACTLRKARSQLAAGLKKLRLRFYIQFFVNALQHPARTVSTSLTNLITSDKISA